MERVDRPVTELGAVVRHLQRTANDGRLRKVILTAVFAFVVGLLLEAQRRSDANDTNRANDANDAKTTGEGDARVGTANQSEPASTESVVGDSDDAVAALSPPTANEMPMLGVGTPQDTEYDECLDGVREAFEIGYRHVDATERRESYYNEKAVGDAIDLADLPREDLFVTTKVDSEDLASDHVRRSAEESLDHLDLDYVDLLYVHWPTDEYEPEGTLEAFAELREEGLVREIGVSNFTADLLEEAVEASPAPVFANLVEMHPLLPQTELREFCARDDVDVELVAYLPTAQGRVEEVDEIRDVADKHDATPEQVSLAWLREKGVTALPEATDSDHLRENWLSLGIDLDPEDVEKIDGIDRRERFVDLDEAPWNRNRNLDRS
ncbi:aldo/keto reductase [Halorussus aquaticus]